MNWLSKTRRNKIMAGFTVVALTAGGWYWYASTAPENGQLSDANTASAQSYIAGDEELL